MDNKQSSGKRTNTIYVRFKTDGFKFVPNSVVSDGLLIERPILAPEHSIKFNKQVKAQAMMLPDNRIDKIRIAEEPLLRTYIVKFESDMSAEDYCAYLMRTNPSVELAEPRYPAKLMWVPSDKYVESGQQDVLNIIHAYEAWEIYRGDTNIVIGISDNGTDQNHEDLLGNIATNWADTIDDADNDDNGYKDDFRGYNMAWETDGRPAWNTLHGHNHGTMTAGVAAAHTNNALGIAGIGALCRFFPIKAGSYGGEYVDYGYESITYAAVRGFKVLNCSWGNENQSYSQIEQDIVNYAVAKDVALIVSGGNYGGRIPWYPAAYDGVLGVGEVTSTDMHTATSMGWHIEIMAQGTGLWTTDFDNSYTSNTSGTSFAAPVVAGVTALARGKYPYLTARQAIEFVRQCTDDISHKNGAVEHFIPGRVNMLKAVTLLPFLMPSIRPVEKITKTTAGIVSNRFSVGDVVLFSIDAFYYLGDAKNLSFELSVLEDYKNSISLIDSSIDLESVDGDSEVKLDGFKFKIEAENKNKVYLRIDIGGEEGYHDFFIMPFTPTLDYTIFENNNIRFSVSDRATIGFGGNENNRQGIGFVYKELGNQLYKSSMMLCEDNLKVETAVYWSTGSADNNDFESVKSFTDPDKFTGIFNDYNAVAPAIDLEITHKYAKLEENENVATVEITLKNTNVERTITNLSAGYYFDWDLGIDPENNLVRLFPEAIPNTYASEWAAAELAYTEFEFPVFAAAVSCGVLGAEAQAAGLVRDIHDIYTGPTIKNALNSGTSIQDEGVEDINMVVGMRFSESIAPGDSVSYFMYFGGGDTEKELANELREKMLSTDIQEIEYASNFAVSVSPVPAVDLLNLYIESTTASAISINIYDLSGRKIVDTINRFGNVSGRSIGIDISTLETGVYIVEVQAGNERISKQFVVLK
ncbi:MAG: S8 family peptidase [Candidatus Kapabacteria bacterium]|nr:S8 family peptidase [Candidatus Kapabacteria bacterium]